MTGIPQPDSTAVNRCLDCRPSVSRLDFDYRARNTLFRHVRPCTLATVRLIPRKQETASCHRCWSVSPSLQLFRWECSFSHRSFCPFAMRKLTSTLKPRDHLPKRILATAQLKHSQYLPARHADAWHLPWSASQL